MAFYGLGTNPILQRLHITVPQVAQVWLADDATGAGKLPDLLKWWDQVKEEGVKFGYFVKPSKSWLVLKDPSKLEETKKLFENSPINITTAGKRHLGAAIGSQEFKEEYIKEKVDKWCQNINVLAEIAKSQPQAAYAAYLHGEQHKYTYFMRTIPDISSFLKPLDESITTVLIPTLFGDDISEGERELISIPIRDGGMGMKILSENSNAAYEASQAVTKPLVKQIIEQSEELPNEEEVKKAKSDAISKFKIDENTKIGSIKTKQTEDLQRILEQHTEKGASSWLGALPLETHDFNLTKSEFQDALALRYKKELKRLPSKCPCGADFTVTHAINCHLGGFVNVRHDKIRDVECQLLKMVVHDVESEPQLQPVVNKRGYAASAILNDEARLDVRARSFWREGQNAFFDVRITNADTASQRNTSLSSILKKHEQEKKRGYNRRVMEVEHGTFTPLIFTTTGVMSHECSVYHKALAEKISSKRDERYEDVMRYLRIKFSYLAIKATLLCLRGSRSIKKVGEVGVDFNLALRELGV